jgi:sialidase-1
MPRGSSSSVREPLAQREYMFELTGHCVIYDNPIPQYRSRHAYFSGVVMLANGELLAMYSVGEAFESSDHHVCISRSKDNGRTWEFQGPLHADARRGTGMMKPTLLDDGRLIALGYAFYRDDPDSFLNRETGGLPPGPNLVSYSSDNGRTWSLPSPMHLSRPELLEISGPCIRLHNGELLAVGTPLTQWDGTRPSGHVGVALRSTDHGGTWDDTGIYFRHPTITPLEARLCQMADGRVVAIVWALDEKNGRSLNNFIAVSADAGRNWSDPIDTGLPAQASNLLPLHDDLLLSIHAHRESEPTGVVARVVQLAGSTWTSLSQTTVWDGATAARVTGFKNMGAQVKFGQPALLSLGDGEYLAYHWAIEAGQGKILGHHLRLAAR